MAAGEECVVAGEEDLEGARRPAEHLVEAVDSDGEGADEDGGVLATTMATFPSDGDDWNNGEARRERRRRRRHEVPRC